MLFLYCDINVMHGDFLQCVKFYLLVIYYHDQNCIINIMIDGMLNILQGVYWTALFLLAKQLFCQCLKQGFI